MKTQSNFQSISVERNHHHPYFITAFADDGVLNLELERIALKELFEKCDENLTYASISNVTINEIINAFIQGKNRVGLFHYAGHANGKQLILEDSPAKADELANFMRGQICVPLVFLNGCSTYEQVAFFKSAGVGAVISTVVEIDDGHAIIFAKRFYESFLTLKRTIEESFHDAKKALIANGNLNISENHFAINRSNRDTIVTEIFNAETKKETPWTLEVFDNNVLSLTLGEIDPFIYRCQLVKPYADWLVKQHSKIKMAGLKETTEIELEKVFVSLRGELSKSFEIFQTQKQLEEKIRALEQSFAEHNLSNEEKQRQKSSLLGRSALMPTIEERDNTQTGGFGDKNKTLNLLDAFLKYDKLIILGDPGTGKTTLARWLVLIFAQSLSSGLRENELKIPYEKFTTAGNLNYAEKSEKTGSFKSVRLPILIRVSEYSQALKKDHTLNVENFLGRQSWLGNLPSFGSDTKEKAYNLIEPEALNRLMLDFIAKGEALIILDGLDEVTNEEERKNVVNKITAFINEIVDKPATIGLPGRNKFIVTSRIAGYHVSPLQHEEFYHVTIQSMENDGISRFSHTWMLAAQNQLFGGKRKPLQVYYEAEELTKQFLKHIFDPARPGIRNLAGNPLLLTELGKIFLNEDQKLPDTRIDLYEKTARNMLDVWRERVKDQFNNDFGIFEDKIFFVLENIAEHIHETYPTGLITADEIDEIVDKSLHEFYSLNPNIIRTHTIHSEKKAFLKVLNEEVGILAARATDLYGFLHLTFEEFFAAKKLLRVPEKITEQILAKAYQPRWREPLMLAIGYLGKKLSLENRKRTLTALLDEKDPMGNLVPRSASLIALAIPEMNYTPDKDLVNDILLKLLNAYSNAGVFDEGEVLRNHVEDTLTALTKNPEVWQEIKTVLRSILINKIYPAELKNATAHLIMRIEAYDADIAQALVIARFQDLRTWKWPIHRAIQAIASTNAGWIGIDGLPMRKFLLGFPENEEVINKSQHWLKVICLLYGGLLPVKQDKEDVYMISGNGIISDSFLTDQIIDLLEAGSSPELLMPFCLKYWQDEKNPVQNRIDCLLTLAALSNELPELFFKLSKTEDDILSNPLKERLDRLMLLLQKPLSYTIKKTLGSLTPILNECKKEDAYRLITALFKIDVAYNKEITNPIGWIAAAPDSLKAQILSEMWTVPFISPDDPPYSMTVILDTCGDTIEKLGLDIIARSFAYIQEASILPPYEKWRIERTHYTPVTEEEIIEKALFNLLALSTEYDFLKFWGLSTLKPLWIKYPRLKKIGILFIYSMESTVCKENALKLFSSNEQPEEELADDEVEKNIESDDQFILWVYATQLKIVRGLKVIKSFPANKKGIFNPAKSLVEIFEILSILRETAFTLPGEINSGTEYTGQFLNKAEILIEQLETPKQKVQSYLKLATYYPNIVHRNRIILLSLLTAETITDIYSLAQNLRDIRPWITEEVALKEKWTELSLRLNNNVYRSVLENRLHSQLITLPEVAENNLSISLTRTGALLRDLNQLFSLPQDIEELWELLRQSEGAKVKEITNKIYEIGVTKRFRLTLGGAMGFSFLLKHDQNDLAKQLIICLEFPRPEAIPIVKEWLDVPDPEINVFAALLMLESGILTARTFQFLDQALFGKAFAGQDQVRNRINLALNSQNFYTSRIGIEGLFLIEKSILDNWDIKPYMTRALAWLYQYLIFDDPDIISSLIEHAKGKGRKSEWALAILGNIHFLTNATFKLFIEALKNETVLIQKRLLKSAIWIIHKWNLSSKKNNLRKEFREHLVQLSYSPDKDVSLFAIDAIGYLEELTEAERQAIIQHTKNEDTSFAALALVSLGRADFKNSESYIKEQWFNQSEIMRSAAREIITREIIKIEIKIEAALSKIEIELGGSVKDTMHALLDASKNLWWDSYGKNCMTILGLFFDQYPEEYEEFLKQTPNILMLPIPRRNDYSYASNIEWMKRSNNIGALASGAEKLPSTFYRGTQKILNIDLNLVNIVLKDGIFTNRMDALTCLSLRREMTSDCTMAFSAALKDISEVQTKAISVMFRFWEISQKFINLVSDLIDTESYSARYAMVNMLASIGNYNKCDSHLRQHILNVLYSKLNKPDFQVPVYLLKKKIIIHQQEDGTMEEREEGDIIEYKGQLDHEIYRRILEVAGVRNPQKV